MSRSLGRDLALGPCPWYRMTSGAFVIGPSPCPWVWDCRGRQHGHILSFVASESRGWETCRGKQAAQLERRPLLRRHK